jgi:hypothetical protein
MYSACWPTPQPAWRSTGAGVSRRSLQAGYAHQHGEDEVRFIMTGILLCVLASTASAGEHYVEIWNPPEARTPGMHAPATGNKARQRHGAKRKLASGDHAISRKVAQPALRESAPDAPAAPGSTAPGRNRRPLIAPQIGPNGNVLQVGYSANALH